MQKKIIALAVAGVVSGAAFAQTNVTVYGIVDQGYAYASSDAKASDPNGTNKFSGLKDGGLNGTRIGFKGEEALGNGLKAIFVQEYGKDIDQNASTWNTRQGFVGLAGDKWGSLTLGRQYNAASGAVGRNNANDVTSVNPYNVIQGNFGSQIRSAGGSARQDNVVKYMSPTWSGFSFAANYTFGETKNPTSGTVNAASNQYNVADVSDNGRYSVLGSYANGPFNIDVAYAGQTNVVDYTKALDGQGKDITEWYVGGAYDFKVVKLYAHYQDLSNDNKATSVATDVKQWSVSAGIPVSAAGRFMIEYTSQKVEYNNNTAAGKPDGTNDGWGIAYWHDLSKRTRLYAGISQIDYDKNVTMDASFYSTDGQVATPGEKSTYYNFGIRHAF